MHNPVHMAATLPPPSWTPSASRGVRVDPRRAVIPVSLAVLTLLAFGLRAPVWVLILASLVVPAFYAWSAWYVHRNLRGFEAEFTSHLTRGDADALWKHYEGAKLLRWLAPTWVMRAKLGLILSLRGDHRAANRVLEEAYDLAPARQRASLLGPLTRTKHALGEFESLGQLAAQWRERSVFPGAPNLYLAAAYIEDPREDSEPARDLLEEATGLSPGEYELRDRLLARLSS